MKQLHTGFFPILLLAGLLPSIGAYAAPLDALLSADQFQQQGEIHAEAAYDVVNSALDVANIRGSTSYANTNVGDYSGAHLRAGFAITDDLFVDGSLWKRSISYRADQEVLNTWQLAGQYQLYGDAGSSDHYALRFSGWGDRASQLSKSTPTTILGRTMTSYSVVSPQDRQLQLDAIGTWRVDDQYSTSAFVGMGNSHVSTGDMNGTYTAADGCRYNINFNPTGTIAKLAAPCAAPVVITSVTTNQTYLQEVNYSAKYRQFGAMLQWKDSDWAAHFGYQFQHLNRGSIDTLIASRKGGSYQINHILVADVSRKVSKNVALFCRAQVMKNQFVGEIPFAYNTVTAAKFNQKYGFLSFGTSVDF
jgi:hypothetical protein